MGQSCSGWVSTYSRPVGLEELELFKDCKGYSWIAPAWGEGKQCCFQVWIAFSILISGPERVRFPSFTQEPSSHQWPLTTCCLKSKYPGWLLQGVVLGPKGKAWRKSWGQLELASFPWEQAPLCSTPRCVSVKAVTPASFPVLHVYLQKWKVYSFSHIESNRDISRLLQSPLVCCLNWY